MPPHPPSPVASSAISAFVDPRRIEALLAPWLPDLGERSFVVRCLIGEGPAHHRGANFVLLSLLGEVALRCGATGPSAAESSVNVPMRLPPHLAARADDSNFPLRLPTAALDRLAPAGSREQSAMIDCLTDGPPQHALANVAMVTLLSAILRRLEDGPK